MEFRTPYNFKLEDRDCETITDPSMTVPDMSYTIPELFARFAAGRSVPVFDKGYYSGVDPDLDDFDPTESGDFDLADYTERQAYLDYLAKKDIKKDFMRAADERAALSSSRVNDTLEASESDKRSEEDEQSANV